MLIVLRKLLELVLVVVGEARVHAEIPAGRQADRQVKTSTDGQRGVSLRGRWDSPVGAFGQVALLLLRYRLGNMEGSRVLVA